MLPVYDTMESAGHYGYGERESTQLPKQITKRVSCSINAYALVHFCPIVPAIQPLHGHSVPTITPFITGDLSVSALELDAGVLAGETEGPFAGVESVGGGDETELFEGVSEEDLSLVTGLEELDDAFRFF